MIKVALTGAHTLQAGELIRILINHPEVEIVALYAPGLTGRSVSSVHHGLIGENIINFTDRPDFKGADVLFMCDHEENLDFVLENFHSNPEMKLIDLCPSGILQAHYPEMQVGLSEINRKALVRGADKAYLLKPQVALALIGLAPLASFMLLPDILEIEIAAPEDIIRNFDKVSSEKVIGDLLKIFQTSFSGNVSIRAVANRSGRVMRVKSRFKCSLNTDELAKIYDSVYDDHNFVFISTSPVEGREIEGTHKTIIYFGKPSSETLEIEIVGDCRLRGGAGDAVHVMNLFFSLFEKTGLTFKPSRFGENEISTSRPANWFG